MIAALPSSGGTATRITDLFNDARQPTWSPDGKWITYFAYRDGGYDVWAVAPDGSNQHKLTWGPFDDRVGYAEDPLPDYDPTQTLLWKYLEGNPKVFRCPKGIDMLPGSPTYGRQVQISYAMNGTDGGPQGQRLYAAF